LMTVVLNVQVRCKGCRSQSRCEVCLFPARCRFAFARWSRHSGCRRSSLNGWVSYEACHRSNDESSSGGAFLLPGCDDISSSSSRLKRPSVCSVRSCRSMTRWNEIKVHVAGVPLSSVVDCGLVVLSDRRWCMESRHKLCFSIWFGLGWRANDGSLVVYGGSSFPIPWKRGPLAPVVGEGAS